MALALNNLKRVDMPLNKETKPNQTKPSYLLNKQWRNIPEYMFIDLSEIHTHTHIYKGPSINLSKELAIERTVHKF